MAQRSVKVGVGARCDHDVGLLQFLLFGHLIVSDEHLLIHGLTDNLANFPRQRIFLKVIQHVELAFASEIAAAVGASSLLLNRSGVHVGRT